MDEETIHHIPLDKIQISESNVRHSHRDRDLEELADGIEAVGRLLQPVVLAGRHGEPPYQLIIGQRRFLAHRDILVKRDGKKWGAIRAVFAGRVIPLKCALLSLAENMHRAELDHADAMDAVTTLYKHYGRDERKVKKATGMSLQRIRKYIYIGERASDKMMRKLQANRVTPQDVKRALQAAGEDMPKAERLLDRMERNKPPKYQKDRLVEYGEAHPGAPADEIWKESQRPRVEPSLMVRLPERTRRGLEQAAQTLAMEPRQVAEQAIDEWLSDKGFIVE